MRKGDLSFKQAEALAQAAGVVAVYIVFARWVVAADPLNLIQTFSVFAPNEARVAAGFANGAAAQALAILLLLALPGFGEARRAVATLVKPAPARGWVIAICIAGVDVYVLYAGWIKDFSRLADASVFGLTMSAVPALDGLTQEILFRGYVLFRLSEARVTRFWQIVLSGAMFGAIHFGYGQEIGAPQSLAELVSVFTPMLGTFGLGAAWAFAFQESGYRLLPVVVSHILVIVLVQPWLALAYASG